MDEKSIRVCGLNFRLGGRRTSRRWVTHRHGPVRVPSSIVREAVCEVRAARCPLLLPSVWHTEGHEAVQR
jgi:hypothetical protein